MRPAAPAILGQQAAPVPRPWPIPLRLGRLYHPPHTRAYTRREVIKDNGKKGQERKLLLSSVLLYKNQRENEERIKRADELHEEENAIPDRH